MCLRNDLEKEITDSDLDLILTKIKAYPYTFTDTVIQKAIYPFARWKTVGRKLKELAKAKLVITDRLHGMVFSTIMGIPCLVISNCNYKIKGVYEWISNNENVVFCDNLAQIDNILGRLLEADVFAYDNSKIRPYFYELKRMVEELYSE